jgi:hypothetical protein
MIAKVDQLCRVWNYATYRLSQEASALLKGVDEKLRQESLKSVRVALAAIIYFGSALAACTLGWTWIVTAYAFHAFLDMTLEAREAEQRWDDLLYRGLNVGLAVRVAYVVLNSVFQFSLGGIAQGMLLGAAIFFKNDWDQYDWSHLRFWSRQRTNPSVVEALATPSISA